MGDSAGLDIWLECLRIGFPTDCITGCLIMENDPEEDHEKHGPPVCLMIIETLRVNPSLSVQLLTLQRTEMSGDSSRHYERGYLEPATRMIVETVPSIK